MGQHALVAHGHPIKTAVFRVDAAVPARTQRLALFHANLLSYKLCRRRSFVMHTVVLSRYEPPAISGLDQKG